MLRPLFLTALSAFILASGCASCAKDCDRLADLACTGQGEGSENCIEVRKRARQATDEDQRYCREAAAIVSNASTSPNHE